MDAQCAPLHTPWVFVLAHCCALPVFDAGGVTILYNILETIMDYIVVEQTKEYKKRIAYEPRTNTFFETEHDCLYLHRGFTHPYGWLKGFGTPPGEHLDIFLLSQEECSLGEELPIKIVGVFKRNDGDHKLIGISPERKEADFSQLPEHEKDDLQRLYPRVSEGEGWFGAEAAKEVITDFVKNGRVASIISNFRNITFSD